MGSTQRQQRCWTIVLPTHQTQNRSADQGSMQYQWMSPEFILLSVKKKKSRHNGISTTHSSLWCTHNLKNNWNSWLETWVAIKELLFEFASHPSWQRAVLPQILQPSTRGTFFPSNYFTSIISVILTIPRWAGKISRPHLAEVKWLCWGHIF
jgi:hypothetical protein